MRCPICQAKLLPVDGELFCLQCGYAVRLQPGEAAEAPTLEETTDPLLQRAIVDAVHHEMHFRLPVAAAAPPKPVASFASMRAVLAPPRAVMAGGVLAMPQPGVTDAGESASAAAGAHMAPVTIAEPGLRAGEAQVSGASVAGA